MAANICVLVLHAGYDGGMNQQQHSGGSAVADLTVSIRLGNDACRSPQQAFQLLADAVARIENGALDVEELGTDGRWQYALRDVNGNKVGVIELPMPVTYAPSSVNRGRVLPANPYNVWRGVTVEDIPLANNVFAKPSTKRTWFHQFDPVLDLAESFSDYRFKFRVDHTGGGCHSFAAFLADEDETPARYALLGMVYSLREFELNIDAELHADAPNDDCREVTYDHPECPACMRHDRAAKQFVAAYSPEEWPENLTPKDADSDYIHALAEWLAGAAEIAFADYGEHVSR